jgi:hypothetical protein
MKILDDIRSASSIRRELCFDNFYQCGTLGYNIGDTVQFTSLKPYRIIVSGRIKHYISAFGEHVIGKEVESALQEAIGTTIRINEFTVAPQPRDCRITNGL